MLNLATIGMKKEKKYGCQIILSGIRTNVHVCISWYICA